MTRSCVRVLILPSACALLLLQLLVPLPALAMLTIDQHVFGSGGGTITVGSVEVQTTVGQPITGFASSESFAIRAGFWPGRPSTPAGSIERSDLPLKLALGSARPNPARPSTLIPYDLPRDSEIVLEVFDVSGRLVRQLWKGNHAAGSHTLKWDGRTDAGRPAPPGVYFYRLSVENRILKRKLVMLR